MKDPGAIRHKLKQAAFRHLKKRLAAELRMAPSNCQHNAEVDLPAALGGKRLGMCHYPATKGQFKAGVCDARYEGIEQAERCPYFALCHSKEDLKAGFRDFLARAPFAEIKRVYPDVAALMWVLQEENPAREPFEDEDTEEVPVPPVTVEIDGIAVQFADDAARDAVAAYLTRLTKPEQPELPEQSEQSEQSEQPEQPEQPEPELPSPPLDRWNGGLLGLWRAFRGLWRGRGHS